jgi:hypothetical protein
MTRQTRFLARLFGLFTIVASIWLLLDQADMRATVDALVRDRAATLLLSFMCLAAGLATVVGHQVWTGGIAPVLVTLFGWVLLVRGALLLLLPARLLDDVADAVLVPVWFHLAGVAALCLGLYLTYAGFRAPPILLREK